MKTQKKMAICLLVLAIASACVEGDGTVAVLLAPLAIWLLTTKKKVVQ